VWWVSGGEDIGDLVLEAPTRVFRRREAPRLERREELGEDVVGSEVRVRVVGKDAGSGTIIPAATRRDFGLSIYFSTNLSLFHLLYRSIMLAMFS